MTRGKALTGGFALAAAGVSWALLWSQNSYWNPLLFATLWVGATTLMYVAGPAGHPGLGVHLRLAVVSVPIWWWFELVNARVANWQYVGAEDYEQAEYFVLTSIAFSTVVPALHSAWRLMGVGEAPPPRRVEPGRRRLGSAVLVALGAVLQILVFSFPETMFPLVWIAPFLMLDGLVASLGGHGLVHGFLEARFQIALRVAAAGFLCGFLWEFWNFWATPKWVYDIPFFAWAKVFEMPTLGYIGYVPFAWSVYHVVQLSHRLPKRVRAVEVDGWRGLPVDPPPHEHARATWAGEGSSRGAS
jgi:hypothetical protein